MINEAGFTLYNKEKPDVSVVGVVFSILSLLFVIALVFMKLRMSLALDSKAARTDALRTAGRAYLPLALAAGLVCHALFGWWWADPVSALLMVPLIVRQGWDSIETSKGNSPSQIVKTDS
jgi:divalent metal cation (Fe/Co/Zn/Cd) transporter